MTIGGAGAGVEVGVGVVTGTGRRASVVELRDIVVGSVEVVSR